MSGEKVQSIESAHGGVKVIGIAGRHVHEKERLAGMTAEDRIWRQKWLKDQCLSPREPMLISKSDPRLMNPIRRFYRAPLDILFFKGLQPFIGKPAAMVFRYYVGRIFLGIWASYGVYYYFKYNMNSWEKKGGWRVIKSRVAVYPGDPGYPQVQQKTQGNEFADRGFKSSIFATLTQGPSSPTPKGFW